MERIFGNANRTVSRITIEGAAFECLGEELRYADYSEKFAGCSVFCLPAGEWECVCRSTDFSPLTLMVRKAPGHRCTAFGWHPKKRRMTNVVMLESREKFEEFQEHVFAAYCNQERISVCVVNGNSEIGK